IFEVIRPGSRAAVAASATGNIGVIATQGTVQSGAYLRALQAAGIEKVLQQACPKFVPLVERGRDDGPEVDAAVAEYLRPLRDGGIDTLVFGCTHYPILRTPIARFLGDGVTLIDPAEPTTDDVQALFGPLPAVCTTEPQRHRFFCSGDPDSLRQVGERLLGFPPGQIEQVNVPVE
ncbi:MAG TPA: aspartate/glutamate racemase family protein, partial [Armatimonadota bacterium]